MGLIRKTLAVGTLGTVSGSSKKQKVAKATMRAAQETAAATTLQARLMVELTRQTQAARPAPAARPALPVAELLSELAEDSTSEARRCQIRRLLA